MRVCVEGGKVKLEVEVVLARSKRTEKKIYKKKKGKKSVNKCIWTSYPHSFINLYILR